MIRLRSWFTKGFRELLVCAVSTTAFCVATPSASALSKAAPELDSAIPIPLGLRTNDDIANFDFTVDDNEFLHVVWVALVRDNSTPAAKKQVWYRRQHLKTGTWSDPVRLQSDRMDSPRILRAGSTLHILGGGQLFHFLSRDNGNRWIELQPVLDASSRGQWGFDVVSDGSDLVVSFVGKRRTKERIALPLAVQVVRWSEKGITSTTIVGYYSRVSLIQPQPRLLRSGRNLNLFYCINRNFQSNPSDSVGGFILISESTDRGLSWSPPRVIGRAGNTVRDFEAVWFRGRFVILYDIWVLYSLSGNGKTWTLSAPVASYRSWSRRATMSSVAAAVTGNDNRVVWIDTRYRQSDVTSKNITTFNPWKSGDPDWANNDILSLSLGHLLDRSGKAAGQPIRLTPHLSYISKVRVAATSQQLYVVWAGRAKVGKKLDTFREPPMLFIKTFG
jgi:hypothetical protein